MSVAFKKYKRIFRRNLQPVFAMLAARRREIGIADWKVVVDQTLQHVIDNPAEYIGNDLPGKELMIDILHEIKSEFLKESFTLMSVPEH